MTEVIQAAETALKVATAPTEAIPKAYLIGGAMIVAFGLFLAIAASYRSAYNKGDAAGADACRAAVATSTANQLAKSQQGILDAQKDLQDEEDRIDASAPGADGPISGVLRDQLVRLRGSASNRPGGLPSPAAARP